MESLKRAPRASGHGRGRQGAGRAGRPGRATEEFRARSEPDAPQLRMNTIGFVPRSAADSPSVNPTAIHINQHCEAHLVPRKNASHKVRSRIPDSTDTQIDT